MSQFLTDQRITQLLDAEVVLGAVDGKNQALFLNLHVVLVKAKRGCYKLMPATTCSYLSDLNMLLQLEIALLLFRRFRIVIVTYFK